MTSAADRRQHARTGIERPCKLFHSPSRAYVPAQTCNLSATGALLRIDSARPISLGEEVGLAIAWSRKAVLESAALAPARVVRVTPSIGRYQSVALRFEQDSALSLAA